MKNTFQKLASVILIMAMVITSVSLDSLQVSAATKKPTKITLNAKSKTLTVGKSFQLKVKSVKPTKASKAVTYKSSKKSVATVSSKGKIVAKKAGKTTITVTSKTNKKVKATCIITVKKKSNPQKNENISKVKNPVVSNGKVTYTCIYFGHYPQSDVTGKKMDNIKWRVLSVKGNDAFLVADQNLDVMPYNETMRKVTWETCTMRSWLNGYGSSANVCGIDYRNENFIDKAFSEKEQAAIYTANVVNKDDPEFGTEGGRDTKDKIFLLSVDEVSNSAYGFLPYKDSDANCIEDAARLRTNTAYVNNGGTVQSEWMKENGPFFVEKDGGYWWWLRSPGSNEYYGVDNASINSCGSILKYGLVPTKYAVCPALHLNLSSSTVWSMADSVTVTR